MPICLGMIHRARALFFAISVRTNREPFGDVRASVCKSVGE